jgi:hypothetical protein
MLKANDQILNRVLRGEVKFPADIEDACVLALPEERRIACARELAGRVGLVAAPAPRTGKCAAADMARLLKSTAATMEKLAPIVADNEVNERDVPYVKEALAALAASQGELVAWISLLTSLLPSREGGE